MKYTGSLAALFIASFMLAPAAQAQNVAGPAVSSGEPSAKKALALSLVVPGLGHRYVHGGDWNGWASVFAVADAGLWAGLLGAELHRDHLVESARTLAAQHAGVDPSGKGREFYLNVATYESSDAFTDAQLRSRNWERIQVAADPSFQWEWDTEEHFRRYRATREKSESLRRRRTFIITTLVANRLIAGVTALRASRRATTPDLRLSLDVPPEGASAPLVRLNLSF